MAQICLVRPLLSPTDFDGYPLNLLILASSLREAGHTVEICDYDFLKEVDPSWAAGGFARRAAADILARAPQFVGVTAMCSNYVLALDLAKELKKLSSGVHVTLGGPHVSLCAVETLDGYDYVDTAVLGEGEVTYPELVACVTGGGDLRDVSGVAFRDKGGVVVTPPRPLLGDLDDSPRPAYDLIDVPAYLEANRSSYVKVYAGSGCPFTCTFCSTSIVWERKYRTMSPERIVGEIQLLKERYGARAFHLVHDNLTVRKPFVADIARLLRERSVDVRWGFSSRIDTIDQATIQAVTAAGCDYIFFGIESGSARTQKTIRKRLRLERIREVLHQCVEHGIAPTTSFILGFPDEDAEDIAATVRLAFECRVLGARRSFINLLSPHTGTPLMREQRDRLVFRQEEANSTMVSFLEPHHVELIASDRYIFAGYYSLDYAGSPLTARQYGDLVDFYTICLFRSRFTVAYLLDQLGIDPLSLFRAHDTEMQSLDVDARNALDVQLTLDDLSSGLPQEARSSLSIMQLFDDALWRVTTSQASSLFSGPLEMGQPGMGVRARPGESPSHYLLSSVSDEEVHVDRLTASLSDLYELQGMPALRWQPPAASKHDAVR